MIPGQIHSRTATALAAVERALAELRRGGIVVLRDDDGAGGLVIAAEGGKSVDSVID
jgi:GTP cyclohydrolase II